MEIDEEVVVENLDELAVDLQDRQTFIGASDAPIILGLSPWTSRYELWLEKTGQAEKPDLDKVERVVAGKLFEDPIAKMYAWKYKTPLRRVNERIINEEHGFPMVAQIDRKKLGERVDVEIKNVDQYMAKEWGDETTEDIPVYYYCQVQHQLEVGKFKYAEVVPLIGGNKLRRYFIQRSDEFIEAMVKAEADFWECVKNNTPPEPITIEEANLRWGNPKAEKVAAEEIGPHLTGFIESRSGKIKTIEKEVKAAKLLLMRMLEAKGDTLIADKKQIATWKVQTKNTFDTEALLAAHPEFKAFYNKVTSSRVFRVNKAGAEFVFDEARCLEAIAPLVAAPAAEDDASEES